MHNPIALRKAKTVYNFGLSECDRVNFLRLAEPQYVIRHLMHGQTAKA